jgi:hypothetical protein
MLFGQWQSGESAAGLGWKTFAKFNDRSASAET